MKNRFLSVILSVSIIFSGVLYARAQDEDFTSSEEDSQVMDLFQEDPGKVSLDLKGMDVVEALKMLASKEKLNIIVGSEVKGRVTLFLKSVNAMDAFDIIIVASKLAYDRRGDIIYVMTQKDYEIMYGEKYSDKKEVRVFLLKYAKAGEMLKVLNQMKTKLGKIVVDEGSNSIVAIDGPGSLLQMSDAVEKLDMPTITKIFELKYAKAEDLKTQITERLTKGLGALQIDERTNKVMVTDLESKMFEIEEMLKAFDDRLQQVLIEAKIVQITLDDKFKLGIDWQSFIRKFNRNLSFKSTFELAAKNTLAPGWQFLIGDLGSDESFTAMVQALKTIGDTNLLSSPRIMALNNQEAKILIGTSQPYAINTVTQGTSTTTTGTNLNFIDVGVKLYVTPVINKDGYVTMKIKPEVSSTNSNYTYGSPATYVPIVQTTQAETSVRVRDGMTIVIAGLIKDERTSTVDKIPILGDIPWLGAAFRKTDEEVKKQELVVFLTPHIISGDIDYDEQPGTGIPGKRKFTLPEKPTFERRNDVDMRSSIFKKHGEKRSWWDEISGLSRAGSDAEELEKTYTNKITTFRTPEDYYYNVKEKIISRIELPKDKKGVVGKGIVKVGFVLSPTGQLVYGPEVLKTSNRLLNDVAMDAVRRSGLFPPFPDSMPQTNRRFVLDILVE